jgi:hypothetical protein
MSANKLMDGSRRSAFAAGAARLGALARPGEPHAPIPEAAPGDRMSAVSPDEAWSRRFMSAGIGPDLTRPMAPVQPIEQAVLAVQEAVVAPEPALAKAFAKPGKPGPIGAVIGKPVRRSLLARVFGRR